MGIIITLIIIGACIVLWPFVWRLAMLLIGLAIIGLIAVAISGGAIIGGIALFT